MIIKLPQVDTPINLGAPPENLEDIVCESFSKYTEGTREKYTFADKLAYIDMLRDWLHPKSSDDVVRDMFRDYFDYQLDENGDIPDHEDYWSMDFFESCVEAGRKPLYARFGNSGREEEIIQKNIVRIIKTVINWGDNNSTIINVTQNGNANKNIGVVNGTVNII